MSNDFSVSFSLEGSMTIRADSADEAERDAVDILEGLAIMDAAGNSNDGCAVRVSLMFVDDNDDERCERLERAPKVVKFS